MAQQSRVPKFGNWENDQDVPYTQYFDKARKGKGAGKLVNPNDPENNMDLHTDSARSVQASPLRNGMEADVRVGEGAVKPKHERRLSKEDLRQLTDSPARHDSAGRKTNIEHHRTTSSGDAPKRAGRQGGGQDRSIEQSPLHPQYQGRTGGRGSGVSSPAWERKSSEGSQGLAPNTPGRSRLRPVARGDEMPDKSAAVPKFGEWDESNPASADGFTHIFNKMREEKQSGSTNVPMTEELSRPNGRKPENKNSTAGRCFSWGKGCSIL